MILLIPLDALIPKIPFSFFSRFLGLGHLQGLGVRLGRILGSCQLSPFWGTGGVRPEGSIDPPPPGNENPASPSASEPGRRGRRRGVGSWGRLPQKGRGALGALAEVLGECGWSGGWRVGGLRAFNAPQAQCLRCAAACVPFTRYTARASHARRGQIVTHPCTHTRARIHTHARTHIHRGVHTRSFPPLRPHAHMPAPPAGLPPPTAPPPPSFER